MDRQQLRNLVFEKTGVKLDVDDPVFALVALNEAVLAEAVERHVARIDAASAELAERARAAGGLPPAAPVAVSEFEPTSSPTPSPAAPAASAVGASPSLAERRTMLIAAGAAVLAAVLVLLGQAVFFRPVPPAPVTVPAPLTAAQIEALATADQFTRALPRLDAKTRAAVLAEMQKR